jgi:hypothetical protein
MLADENLDIKRIIMVTNFIEGRVKCHDYSENALDGASDKGMNTNFGKITDFQLCRQRHNSNTYELRYINPEFLPKSASMPTPPPSPPPERPATGKPVQRGRLPTQFTRPEVNQQQYTLKHSNWLSSEQKKALFTQAQKETSQIPQRPTQPKPLIFGSTPMSRLKIFISNRKFISGCDCKIILLFYLVNKLFSKEEDEDKIKGMIETTVDRTNVIKYTEECFDLIGLGKPKKFIPISCNINSNLKDYTSLSDYLNDQNLINKATKETGSNVDDYKQLFDVKDAKEYDQIVSNLTEIFGKGGNYIASNDDELTTDIFKSDYELKDEEEL